jgi:hypothetical protein
MSALAFAKYVEKMLKNIPEGEFNGSLDIVLPIKEIDNIPVECYIEFDLSRLTIEINVYYKYFGTTGKSCQESLSNGVLETDDKTPFFTNHGDINFPEEFAQKVKKITGLKFDHFLGKFVFGEVEDNSFLRDFFECENVKLDFDICVVCYKNTKTVTNCDHHLCLECWGKLPPSCDLCKVGRKCPTCRNEYIEHSGAFCEECN